MGSIMLNLNNAGKQTEPKDNPTTQSPQDPIQAFSNKLAEHGFEPGGIIQDGELHRFGKNKVCWYVFYYGDICGAAFGDWSAGVKGTWCSVSENTLTFEQREKHRKDMEAAKATRKVQEKKNHAKAQIKAWKQWDAATSVIGKDHPYLKKKGVDSYFLKVDKKGRLLIPSLDENRRMHSLQYIRKDGTKKYQPMGARKGFFFEFPGNPSNNNVFVCEGYSTGASIREATGATVICAFDSGNLPRVAMVTKSMFPSHNITIAADDDAETVGNPGVTKAKEAARMINALAIWPTFKRIDPDEKRPSDFNDLFAREGITAVFYQLSQTEGQKQVTPPLPAVSTSLNNWLIKRPKNREYILNLFGVPFMPKDIVGALAATGGTGKTFFLMALAIAMASGGKFGPISVPKPLKVLCVFGEDDQDELGRRFWDICKGKFPENLHAASVYGQVGPLMELDEKRNPKKAAGFDWMEKTIQNHPRLDVFIFDPKSRFYGLDENNNDHGTAWISCLEELRMRYGVTILFSAHTSEANAGSVSQVMNRGASSIIDGCRWQAGMAAMDKNTADRYSIDDRQNYVIFDAPKSNYTARMDRPIFFKRGEGGVLEYTELKSDKMAAYAKTLHGLLLEDGGEYTQRDLKKGDNGKEICQAMKLNCKSFERKTHTEELWHYMIQKDLAKEVGTSTGNGHKIVLKAIEK